MTELEDNYRRQTLYLKFFHDVAKEGLRGDALKVEVGRRVDEAMRASP